MVSSMIGSGVFLSTGFMVATMNPNHILLAWIIGGILAFCGAVTYAEMSTQITKSGGEYQYITERIHPSMGYLVGYSTIVLGFAFPIAIDSIAAAVFFNGVYSVVGIKTLSTIFLCGILLVHLGQKCTSLWFQNILVILKVLILTSIIILGCMFGNIDIPTWTSPGITDNAFPTSSFLANQFWIAYTLSGFNAAIYIAGSFEKPQKHVPRAILIGFGTVIIAFIALNYLFLSNLTPDVLAQSASQEQPILGHLLLQNIIGDVAGPWMSLALVIIFLSSVSTMIMLGPQIFKAMIRDGNVPTFKEIHNPTHLSTIVFGVIALSLIWLSDIHSIVEGASFIIFLFSGLTAACLLWSKQAKLPSRIAASVYLIGVSAMLGFGVYHSEHLFFIMVIMGGLFFWGWKDHQKKQENYYVSPNFTLGLSTEDQPTREKSIAP